MAMATATAARQFLATAAASSSSSRHRRCISGGCDMREDGGVEALLQCQKVSDLLIAASFLSIPLELFYFATCADLSEVKCAVLHFCAFIVLGGATHLLAALAASHPNSASLLRYLTAAKALAAVASCVAAVSLLTFIPKLLRIKVRESLLRDKASRLHRDLGIVRRREEATSRAVRALTCRIRGTWSSSPLDADAVLRTTALQLAHALGLHAAAVWMPAAAAGAGGGGLVMVHRVAAAADDELVGEASTTAAADDRDVLDVMSTKVAKVLSPDSALATASGGGGETLTGAVAAAAIRIPMLRVSIYGGGGGTPEVTESSYAILVLILPYDVAGGGGGWSSHDLEIIQVVADQAAVALSHAAVLEESRSMRDRFAEQHRTLMQARHEAAMATRAFSSIQSVMCDAMRRPVNGIVGMVSMLQNPVTESLRPEQRLAVDAIARTSTLLSVLMDDVMDAVTVNRQHLCVQKKVFSLQALIRDAIGVASCLSRCRGAGFLHQPECALPEWVIGDDRRVFHLLLDMVGALLNRCNTECGACRLSFSVRICNVGEERYSLDWIPMRPSFSGCNVCVKFKVGIERSRICAVERSFPCQSPRRSAATTSSEMGHVFSSYCNKIVQMMNGNMWSASDSEGVGESVTLILQFKLQQGHVQAPGESLPYIPHFNGLRVLLADHDAMNREVTKKILERLGCQVMSVPSGAHCLSLLASADASFQLVILDLDDCAMATTTTTSTAIDGFEAAVRIRELRNSCWLLIVIFVAAGVVVTDDSAAVQELCQRAGINGLVQKPVTLQTLGAQLCRVLQDN
uniref:Ethylene receptor n=1 Tax=Leersia perrieri TaxID=77586 RepID=A0A0D9WXE3_9ORYZ